MQLNSILGSCLLGLGLCIPNILVQIIMCIMKKNTASWINILMNILLHMAHANIIGKFINLGEKFSLYIGIGLIFLYIIVLCKLLQLKKSQKYQKNSIYSLLNILSCTEKLENFPDLVSFNRKIPPRILFYGQFGDDGGKFITNNFSKTLVKAETPRYLAYDESFEFIYKSWQDETKLESFKDISIVKVEFGLEIKYKDSAQRQAQEILRYFDEQRRNGHDSSGLKGDNFMFGCIYSKRCYTNREEYMRIKKYKTCVRILLGIILLILGYSSIFNTFIRFIIIECPFELNFNLIKLVSLENNLRAKYNERDENIPDLIEPNEKKSSLDINQEEQNQQMEELKNSLL